MIVVEFVQQLTNGILTGMTYALVAVGLVLIFSVLRAINFAHGEYYMLGALIAWTVLDRLRWPYVVAVVGAAMASAAIGYVVSRVLMERLLVMPLAMAVLATLGVQLVLQNGAQIVWGASPKFFGGGWITPVAIGDVGIVGQQLVIFAAAALAFAGLAWLVRRTRLGRAMRAVAQNREACAVVGLDVERVARVTFTLGVTFAGLAGALVGPVLVNVGTTLGLPMVLRCFAVIVLGGVGSVPGALVGGLILGVTESFVAGYLTLQLRDAVGFVILITMLLVRPRGLFGVSVRA
ncbi:MAG TPA: branched-chain amino acid ABC transporter permease [Methylomirabilota bacterium]|nr:branched-chain amino acid ABC transporter permease [Methylomirabilota bacterium]